MTIDYMAAFAAEKRQLHLERLFHDMEHELTPAELQGLLPQLDRLDGFLGKLVASSATIERLRHEAAETFVAADPYPGIRFFADPSLAKGDKSLIIGFCGNLARLLIPTGQFLQFIPATQFDVLVLADERDRSFETAAGAIRGTMPAWVRRVVEEFEVGRYRAVYCYGTSMGGFPALRTAPMFGARRAISVAGTFSWPINRLRGGEEIAAFDPLCVCRPAEIDLVTVCSAGHARDAAQAAVVRARVGARPVEIDGPNHNVIYDLLLAGKLGEFLGSVFDFTPKPPLARPELAPAPKARKDLRGQVERLLERAGLRKQDVPPPQGFVVPRDGRR